MATPLVTAEEMREIDRLTIEDAGIPGLVLMENAGRRTAEVVMDVLEELEEGPAVVVCGHGNNGGDGFVVARYLHNNGVDVHCVLVSPRDRVEGDALRQLDIVDTLGVPVYEAHEEWGEEAELVLDIAAVVVDAVLGTGLQDAVRGSAAEAIMRINGAEGYIVAVDLPSGLSADTGQVMGAAVVADVTVTFGLPKRGLVIHPGLEHAGELVLADISIPPAVVDHVRPVAYLSDDLEAPYLPQRPPNTHKGHYGHILIVGGAPGMAGAPLMSAMAALRSGAGLVSIITDVRCQMQMEARFLELMVGAGWAPGDVPHDGIVVACETRDAVVVGPGLEPDETGRAVLEAVLAADVPVICDAGAITLLADMEIPERSAPLIITPHPGEAGLLLECTAGEVQADRFGAITALARRLGCIVVLKGARTLVASMDNGIAVNTTGNAGLATAGSGDVLAGIIGALSVRFDDPFEAARVAVHVHGKCGDEVAEQLGQDSLIAGDLIGALPSVLNPDDDEDE